MTIDTSGPGLIDAWGRAATDVRVSLTDRCNLRCTYCMPAEGLEWLPSPQVLTDVEVVRLVSVAVELLGISEVRFTGGEPLVRRGLEDIVAATADLRTPAGNRPEISLTTNGLGLDRRASGLVRSGLDRVNVSLDSLDRAQYALLARRDRLPDVLAGLRAAEDAGLHPIKINTVLLRGVNEGQAVPLLKWSIRHGYELRFIEQMPLGPPHTWDRAAMVTAEEILGLLATEFELQPAAPTVRAGAPAELWTVAGTGDTPATVGVIGAVTRPFCSACDRTRLTADGQIRNCLFAADETDLRTALRAGVDDQGLAAMWQNATWGKKVAHGIGSPGFHQPSRLMSAIGG